ncbi:hypothetical protein DRQ00_06450 [candidate division KSB1 bacterium]|nr:MAG: hypothetical protein DRQ00_06450 [candidate division KSB1 bacterium]HHE64575.1 hypothetical protein [Bacteroidota bacterium]
MIMQFKWLKKKKKNISILIVPDDYSEPISLRVSTTTLKLLIVVAIILTVHSILGAVFYWRYALLQRENNQLTKEKARLEKENSKVNKIVEQFAGLQRFADKLKTSMGINSINNNQTGDLSVLEPESSPLLQEPPDFWESSKQSPSSSLKNKLNFIMQRQSSLHDLVPHLPTLLPVDGFITCSFDDFNKMEVLHRERHLGIDIAAKKGSVIKAAGDGLIVFADWTPELGNLIIIYHGGNIFSRYGHNLRLLKTHGWVHKGEPIALLGSSGRTSSGPHLHFEIWENGIPVDPVKYIFALQKKDKI